MDGRSLTEEYIDIVKEHKDIYYEDYKKAKNKARNSNARYKDKPVPFLYQPMFFTEKDIENFKKAGNILMSIANKVTDRYIHYPKYREKFKYPKLLEELILVDQGYDINIPISRFDLFYDGGDDFKFIEVNTDGSSGMNEDNIFANIMLESKPIKEMQKKYNITYFELINSWVQESLNIYSRFKNKVENPNIAIVDFKETGITAEFQAFREAYRKKGYNVEIVDPRDLRYINGKLYYGDMRIDMIYRRIVTVEFIEKSQEIPDLIEAYRDGAVCVIGSLRSQIMHNKIIFKILHDADTQEFLMEEEVEFIKKHIPYTEEFAGDKKVFEEVRNNKDKYIVKPMDSFASQGVHTGRDYAAEEWVKILEDCWGKNYLFQQFIDPPTRPFVLFDEEGNIDVEDFKLNIGVYMYNEQFAGVYTRISRENIIFGREGYYSIPNLLIM